MTSKSKKGGVYCMKVKGGTKYKGPYGEIFIPNEYVDIDDEEEEEETEESSIEEDNQLVTFNQENISDKHANDNMADETDQEGYIEDGDVVDEEEEEETEESSHGKNFIQNDDENVANWMEYIEYRKCEEKVEKESLKSKDTTTKIKTPRKLKTTKVIMRKEKGDNTEDDDMDEIYAKHKENNSDKRNVALLKKEVRKYVTSIKKEKDLSEKVIDKENIRTLENDIKFGNIPKNDLKEENKSERKYKCRRCLQTFLYELDLVSHVMTHSKEDNFHCGECNKIFSKGNNRDVHLRNVHNLDDRQFSCKWCLETFSDKGQKDIHLQVHTKGDSFSCNICQKTFLKCSRRNMHLRTHAGQQRWKLLEKKFQCSQCPTACLMKNELKIHSRIHSGEKPHSCKMCPKTFTQISNLNAHIKVHTGEKKYTCNQCEKSFSQKIGLNRHIKMHLGIKDINCNECTKSFASKQNLRGHMKIHIGVKMYTCELCPKQFYNSQGMKKHVKRTHADIKSEENYNEDNKIKETFSQGNMEIEMDENGSLCSPNGENFIQNGNRNETPESYSEEDKLKESLI